MLKSILIRLKDGSEQVVHEVDSVVMDGPLILYGEDENMIAGFPLGGWESWKVFS